MSGEKTLKAFPLNIRNKTAFGLLNHDNQRGKKKRNPYWKRRNKTSTVADMILYIENPKNATRKLLELISEFDKVAEYKINIGICCIPIY